MSRFFVGQRVRIKWSLNWPEIAGDEGRILGVSPDRGVEGLSDWEVSVDRWRGAIAPSPGMNGATKFCPSSGQLEPILPEGHQPSEFTTLQDLLASLEVTA